MLNTLLINNCEIFEKQIVNESGIRKENLISKGTWKGRLAGFYTGLDKEALGIQKIVEDKRMIYLEPEADVKKGDIIKVDGKGNYEVINIYNVQDSSTTRFIKILVKQNV